MLPQLRGASVDAVSKGGCIVYDKLIIRQSTDQISFSLPIGTGSELEIAEKVAAELRKHHRSVRVVSLVCWELFEEQPEVYKESVLPSDVTSRLSIEAGVTFGWDRYIRPKGIAIGVNRFGSSSPGGKIYMEFGLTVENVIATAKTL
jgi:transketolase